MQLPGSLQIILELLLGYINFPAPPLLAGMFAMVSGAIGKGAILESKFSPTPINSSIGFVCCGPETGYMEQISRALAQPLYDEQDRRVFDLSQSVQSVEERIRELERRSESYFASDIVRDPNVELQFRTQKEALRSLSRSTFVALDPDGKTLWQAAANSNGMTAIYRERSLAKLLDEINSSTRSFELAACALQGRTPGIGSRGALIRPVVATLLICHEPTAVRLITSKHPVVSDYVEQLVFCPLPIAGGTPSYGRAVLCLPPIWSERLATLAGLRDSGKPRRLRLSRNAEALLAREAAECKRDAGRRVVRVIILAQTLSLILQLWQNELASEISERIIHDALAVSHELLESSDATVRNCVVWEQEEVNQKEIARMRTKLANFSKPIFPRELYRTYDDQRKELHEPRLEFLLRAGQARRLEDGRVEIAEPALGGLK